MHPGPTTAFIACERERGNKGEGESKLYGTGVFADDRIDRPPVSSVSLAFTTLTLFLAHVTPVNREISNRRDNQCTRMRIKGEGGKNRAVVEPGLNGGCHKAQSFYLSTYI